MVHSHLEELVPWQNKRAEVYLQGTSGLRSVVVPGFIAAAGSTISWGMARDLGDLQQVIWATRVVMHPPCVTLYTNINGILDFGSQCDIFLQQAELFRVVGAPYLGPLM